MNLSFLLCFTNGFSSKDDADERPRYRPVPSTVFSAGQRCVILHGIVEPNLLRVLAFVTAIWRVAMKV